MPTRDSSSGGNWVRSQLGQQLAIGQRPPLEAAQAEELVGGMELFVVQAEAEAYHVRPQVAQKELADGYAATQAHVVGGLAVQLREHRGGHLVTPMVRR